MSAQCLPDDVWLCIMAHLDYKDLVSCSFVNRRLNDISACNVLWMKLCKTCWLDETCPDGLMWKDHFINWYKDFGPYIKYYSRMKTAWIQITDYMKTNCPTVFEAIKPGISEAELNAAEAKINFKLPPDLRCSYRIQNGQKLNAPGLFGNVYISNYYRSAALLDIDTASGATQSTRLRGCMPLTICIHSGFSEYISLSNDYGINSNNIVCSTEDPFGPSLFISGENFMTWLTSYVDLLVNGHLALKEDCVLRFHHEPECVASTGGIQVSAATCFIPELSTIKPPRYVHAYRITMQMDKNSPPSESCKLETRHWVIIDEDGDEERVVGDGVVGEYPEMRPGASYSWISCTTFSTTYGCMKGHFKMRNFKTGYSVDVKCPTFHMKCFPYMTLRPPHAPQHLRLDPAIIV